jgi:hypothetical protein
MGVDKYVAAKASSYESVNQFQQATKPLFFNCLQTTGFAGLRQTRKPRFGIRGAMANLDWGSLGPPGCTNSLASSFSIEERYIRR